MANQEIKIIVSEDGLGQLISNTEKLINLQKVSSQVLAMQVSEMNELSKSAGNANNIVNDFANKLSGIAAGAALLPVNFRPAMAAVSLFGLMYVATKELMSATGAEATLSNLIGGPEEIKAIDLANKKIAEAETQIRRFKKELAREQSHGSVKDSIQRYYDRNISKYERVLKREKEIRDRISKGAIKQAEETEKAITAVVKNGVADRTGMVEQEAATQAKTTQKVAETTQAINEVINVLETKNSTNKKVEKSEGELAIKLDETATSLKSTSKEVETETDSFVESQTVKTSALDDFTNSYTKQSDVISNLSQDWTNQTEQWLADSIGSRKKLLSWRKRAKSRQAQMGRENLRRRSSATARVDLACSGVHGVIVAVCSRNEFLKAPIHAIRS